MNNLPYVKFDDDKESPKEEESRESNERREKYIFIALVTFFYNTFKKILFL